MYLLALHLVFHTHNPPVVLPNRDDKIMYFRSSLYQGLLPIPPSVLSSPVTFFRLFSDRPPAHLLPQVLLFTPPPCSVHISSIALSILGDIITCIFVSFPDWVLCSVRRRGLSSGVGITPGGGLVAGRIVEPPGIPCRRS